MPCLLALVAKVRVCVVVQRLLPLDSVLDLFYPVFPSIPNTRLMMSVHPYMDKYKVLFAYIVLKDVKYFRSFQVASVYLLSLYALRTPLFLVLIVCSPML